MNLDLQLSAAQLLRIVAVYCLAPAAEQRGWSSAVFLANVPGRPAPRSGFTCVHVQQLRELLGVVVEQCF
ncbi:hypothetical protein [Streptomyces sp. NPDC087212]|uniref:hypothetical protein n=1 Tax=Streptomyces sp. NPDC087212 TaxID=3365766 RepID=UPI003804118A